MGELIKIIQTFEEFKNFRPDLSENFLSLSEYKSPRWRRNSAKQ